MSEPESSPNSRSSQSSHSTDDEIDEVEFADPIKISIQEVGDVASQEQSTSRAQDGGGAAAESELVNSLDPPLPCEAAACLKPVSREDSNDGRSSAAYPWHTGAVVLPLPGTGSTARSYTEETSITSSTEQPKSRESEQRTIIKEVQGIVRESPDALGLAILVASTRAKPALHFPVVQGVEKGRKIMETQLQKLCYAVLSLPVDITSSILKATMKAVASDEIPYPKNYRRFIFYYTGHGRPNTICTPDGDVELQYITNPLEKISDRSKEPIPIILIFDSCSVGMLHSARNTLVISASLPGSLAYASTGQCGLLTEYLAPALTDPAYGKSSLEEITTYVTKEVNKVLSKHEKSAKSTPVVFFRNLQETIRPQQERTRAMKPILCPIPQENIHPTSVIVHITRPQLANHLQLQHLLLEHQCEGEEPKTVRVRAAGETMIRGLRPGRKYTLTAVAHYPNNETAISSDKTVTIPNEVKPRISPVKVKATSATVSVDHPHLVDQHGVQRLSVEYRRNGEVQWLPVQDQVEGTVTVTGLSTFTQYQVRAIAHYPGDVLVNSEPLSIKTQRKSYQLFTSLCCPISLLLLLLSCIVMAVVVHDNVYGIPAHRPLQDITKRLLENDTILLFITNSLSEREAVISECPVEGDGNHFLKVFLLKTKQEVIHEYSDTYSASGSTFLYPSRPTLLGDEYMLEGSFFVANICLTSAVSHTAFAYIFDSYDGNQEYVGGGTNKTSIYQQTLPVGNNLQPICSVVNYTAVKPKYYYLSLDVPWNVEYNYSIFRYVRYLNYMDYVDTGDEPCKHDISDLDSCTVKFPGFLSSDVYLLLVYSETTSQFFPKATHVCVSFRHDLDLYHLFIIFVVLLFLILLIFIVYKIHSEIIDCFRQIGGYRRIV